MLIRRLLGDDIPPDLRALLLAVGAGAVGQFAFFAFFAVWAITELDAPATQVGLAYAASALAAVAGGVIGGRVSDRVGRRPVVVAASVVQLAAPAVLLVPRLPLLAAYAVLMVMAFVQPVRGTAQRALLADLTAEEDRVGAFAAFRVALNLGAAIGPLAGAALVAISWDALYGGISGAYALALAAALRLPERERRAASGAPSGSPWLLVRDPAFALVFVATVAAWFVYNAFELLAPVALTQTHGFAPSTWGLLFALNPIAIVLFQMRLTRWAERIPQRERLAGAALLMAVPFLVLELTAAVPVVAVIVLVAVVGEMLWAPTSEAIVARMAPPHLRGLYLGTATAAAWTGAALCPALGLAVRDAAGDFAMWALVAAVGAASAGLYAVALRSLDRPLQQSPRDRSQVGHCDSPDSGDACRDRGRRGRRRAAPRGSDGQPARAARG